MRLSAAANYLPEVSLQLEDCLLPVQLEVVDDDNNDNNNNNIFSRAKPNNLPSSSKTGTGTGMQRTGTAKPLQLLISFPLLTVRVKETLLLVLFGMTTMVRNILLTVQVLQAIVLMAQFEAQS